MRTVAKITYWVSSFGIGVVIIFVTRLSLNAMLTVLEVGTHDYRDTVAQWIMVAAAVFVALGYWSQRALNKP